MKRLVTAFLVASGCVLMNPQPSDAGVIPWTYNAIFGYGPYTAWRPNFYAPSYAPMYAPPAYTPTYGASYGYGSFFGGYGGYPASTYAAPACSSCNSGVVVNYGPYDSGCCNSCNTGCSPCGDGCNSGCSSCEGGSCGDSQPSPPPADPGGTYSGSVPEKTPTYSSPDPSRNPAGDDFERAQRNLEGQGNSSPGSYNSGTSQPGSSIPGSSLPNGTGNSEFDGGITPETGSSGFPDRPAPGEPGRTRGNASEDMGSIPEVAPIEFNAKVAFVTPAGFSRIHSEPRFRLPKAVASAQRVHHEAPASTIIASK